MWTAKLTFLQGFLRMHESDSVGGVGTCESCKKGLHGRSSFEMCMSVHYINCSTNTGDFSAILVTMDSLRLSLKSPRKTFCALTGSKQLCSLDFHDYCMECLLHCRSYTTVDARAAGSNLRMVRPSLDLGIFSSEEALSLHFSFKLGF